jgi:hypothetical protein
MDHTAKAGVSPYDLQVCVADPRLSHAYQRLALGQVGLRIVGFQTEVIVND